MSQSVKYAMAREECLAKGHDFLYVEISQHGQGSNLNELNMHVRFKTLLVYN